MWLVMQLLWQPLHQGENWGTDLEILFSLLWQLCLFINNLFDVEACMDVPNKDKMLSYVMKM